MSKQVRKQIVKRTLGHYDVLLEHATRDYEVPPRHILRRVIRPLCEDFADAVKHGLRNDFKEIIEGFAKKCASTPRLWP